MKFRFDIGIEYAKLYVTREDSDPVVAGHPDRRKSHGAGPDHNLLHQLATQLNKGGLNLASVSITDDFGHSYLPGRYLRTATKAIENADHPLMAIMYKHYGTPCSQLFNEGKEACFFIHGNPFKKHGLVWRNRDTVEQPDWWRKLQATCERMGWQYAVEPELLSA